MELPDHRLRSALRKSWPNSPPVPLAAAGSRLPDRATAANEIDDAFSGLSPVDQAVVFEDFGRRTQRCVLVGLYDGGDLPGSDPFDGLHDQIGSDGH